MEIQVVKSDGSPVRDGTEVVVTVSSGEIVQSRVRTTWGVASVEYRAATGPGVVEVQAMSDAAQGALSLPIASAAVARITIEASPGMVPLAGGPIELKATAVVSARVQSGVSDVLVLELEKILAQFEADGGELRQRLAPDQARWRADRHRACLFGPLGAGSRALAALLSPALNFTLPH